MSSNELDLLLRSFDLSTTEAELHVIIKEIDQTGPLI